MNQRQLNAFRMVMRHGSITAAAGVLGISQPAVSRLIADLEADLGFALLRRRGGRAVPTAEATAFFQEVERLFYGFDRLKRAGEDIRTLRQARLRIAAMPALSFEIVPRLLRDFLVEHPGVRVTHDVHTSARIADLVSARQFDLGLAQMPLSRTDVQLLGSYRMACVCAMPPNSPLAKRAALSPADLAGVPIVALAQHTQSWGHLMQSFLAASIQPNIAVESQPSYAACGFAAMGVGVAIVDPLTPRIFGPEKLATVPFEPAIPFDFHLIAPLDTEPALASRAFIDATLNALAMLPYIGPIDHNI